MNKIQKKVKIVFADAKEKENDCIFYVKKL